MWPDADLPKASHPSESTSVDLHGMDLAVCSILCKRHVATKVFHSLGSEVKRELGKMCFSPSAAPGFPQVVLVLTRMVTWGCRDANRAMTISFTQIDLG